MLSGERDRKAISFGVEASLPQTHSRRWRFLPFDFAQVGMTVT